MCVDKQAYARIQSVEEKRTEYTQRADPYCWRGRLAVNHSHEVEDWHSDDCMRYNSAGHADSHKQTLVRLAVLHVEHLDVGFRGFGASIQLGPHFLEITAAAHSCGVVPSGPPRIPGDNPGFRVTPRFNAGEARPQTNFPFRTFLFWQAALSDAPTKSCILQYLKAKDHHKFA